MIKLGAANTRSLRRPEKLLNWGRRGWRRLPLRWANRAAQSVRVLGRCWAQPLSNKQAAKLAVLRVFGVCFGVAFMHTAQLLIG